MVRSQLDIAVADAVADASEKVVVKTRGITFRG